MLQRSAPSTIPNTLARRIFMQRQGLLAPPTPKQTKADLQRLIEQLGFVQIDSIATVERAHHMTLFARNQTYQRRHLTDLLENDRALFENWTHDASMIPTAFYPYWQRHFQRHAEHLRTRWQKIRREGFDAMLDDVLGHIERDGPVMSRSFARDEKKGS
ncbi:MAG: DNA glycosylase AlkZ-like family protein, partial [Hyphomicrobiaceae bacterium]